MASKVLVGLPQHGPFPSKKYDDLFSIGYVGSQPTPPETRIKQLEQNIRFLQEQHQIMLSGLHREIETLRRRNRDLQFQMVFPKSGVTVLQTSPTLSSSPEDESHIQKLTISPGQANITPLQIELLERDLADLKTNFSESRTRNVYLQGVIDEQKKTIQSLQTDEAAAGKMKPSSAESLQEKFDESERKIRRLRRENEEQRKEINSLRMATDGKNAASSHHRKNQYSQTSRFPPLNPNNHWNHSKNGRRDADQVTNTTLPLLKERTNGPTTSNVGHYQSGGHRRGYPRSNRAHRNHHRDQPEQQD